MTEEMQHIDTDPTAPAPSEARAVSLGYWFSLMLALLVLMVLSAKAYQWLNQDVQQRRLQMQAQMASPEDQGQAEQDASGNSALPALTEAKPAAGLTAPNEPVAPAVLGQTVHKCVQDGRVVLTNKPCPEGSAPATSTVVPSGLASSSTWAGRNQSSQHAAQCGFLQAEIERLDFEFRQALPPPVLDHISTELGQLRQQAAEMACPVSAGKKSS